MRYNSQGTYAGNRQVGYADGNGNLFIDSYHVAPNETLLIQKGVTVHFDGYSANQFVVYGSLQAIGTESEPIVFTSNYSNPQVGDWDGIQAKKAAKDVHFEHCRFEYSDVFRIYNTSLTMKNCEFYESSGISMGLGKYQTTAILTDNVIHNPPEKAGYVGLTVDEVGEAIIENNVIHGPNLVCYVDANKLTFNNNQLYNESFGLVYRGSDFATVSNNIVHGSYLDLIGNLIVTNNQLIAPNSTAVIFGMYDYKQIVQNNTIIGDVAYWGEYQNNTIDAQYNYWGTVNRSDIYERLHRWDEDMGWNVSIDFEPYLDENGDVYVDPGPSDGVDGDGNGTDGNGDTVFYIILACMAAALLILLAVLLVVFIRRRRGRAGKPAEEPTDVEALDE